MISLFISCSMNYSCGSADEWTYGYSDKLNNCFLGTYYWDGNKDTMQIDIPERFNGYDVTKLGGFTGRGLPMSFNIDISKYIEEHEITEKTVSYEKTV